MLIEPLYVFLLGSGFFVLNINFLLDSALNRYRIIVRMINVSTDTSNEILHFYEMNTEYIDQESDDATYIGGSLSSTDSD